MASGLVRQTSTSRSNSHTLDTKNVRMRLEILAILSAALALRIAYVSALPSDSSCKSASTPGPLGRNAVR